jgi:hypothetical protein
MAEWVDLGKDFLALATKARYAFAIWATALIVLLAPVPSSFRIDALRGEAAPYVAIVFFFAFIVWIVEVSLIGWEKRKERKRKEEEKREERNKKEQEERTLLNQLCFLNSREAHLLVRAVTKQVQTVIWQSKTTEVYSLVSKGLLVKVPDDSGQYLSPFTVPCRVWEEINKTDVLEKLKTLDKEPPS